MGCLVKEKTEIHGLDSSLLDFQERLAHLIKDPSTDNDDGFIGMSTSQGNWLLDLSYLNETSVPSKIATIGGVSDWVLGIASFRGQVITVLDMQKILDGNLTENTHEGWITIIQERWSGFISFLWPKMKGLISQKDLKESQAEKKEWSKAVWEDSEGDVWQELDIERILKSKFVISE